MVACDDDGPVIYVYLYTLYTYSHMRTRTGMRAPVRCARQPLAYIIVIVIMIAIGLVFRPVR